MDLCNKIARLSWVWPCISVPFMVEQIPFVRLGKDVSNVGTISTRPTMDFYDFRIEMNKRKERDIFLNWDQWYIGYNTMQKIMHQMSDSDVKKAVSQTLLLYASMVCTFSPCCLGFLYAFPYHRCHFQRNRLSVKEYCISWNYFGESWCTPLNTCGQSLFMSTLVTCQSWSFVNEMIFPYQNNLRHILLRMSFLPSCCLYHSRNDIAIITLPEMWMFLLLFFMKNLLCINVSCHENKTRLTFSAWNGDTAYQRDQQ